MYHHWGCTSIYRQLSYPFKSLIISTEQIDPYLINKHTLLLSCINCEYESAYAILYGREGTPVSNIFGLDPAQFFAPLRGLETPQAKTQQRQNNIQLLSLVPSLPILRHE